MKSTLLPVLLLVCLPTALPAQHPGWYQDMAQLRGFLDRQDVLFETYSVALGDAYYDYYCGILKDPSVPGVLKRARFVERDSMDAAIRHWLPRREQIPDTQIQRRLIQWENILIAYRVNHHPPIRELQSEIERWLVTPDSVPGRPTARELEAMSLELLRERRTQAMAIGFPGYGEMLLQVTGIPPDSLRSWLVRLDSLTLGPYREMVAEMKAQQGIEEVGIQDVFRLYFRYFQAAPPEPSGEEQQQVLSATLSGLGMRYDTLPILQREMYLPPPMGGQGIAVMIPSSFKLVVNPNVGLSTLLHEVGHGLACVYTRTPYAVLKGYEWVSGGTSPAMAEGLAGWAAGIMEHPLWMKTYGGLTDSVIDGKIRDRMRYAPVNIRFWLYTVRLEQEIFSNPDRNVDSLRSELLSHYLSVERPSTRPHPLANSMYISYPVYNHNYLLAEVIQWQIHRELERRLGSGYLSNPETASLMQEYFYRDGEYYHWQEKLRRFTGKGLDIEGYLTRIR